MTATTTGEPAMLSESTHSASPPPLSAASSQVTHAVKDIAFGSVAGAMAKVIEYPFDTVKVRLQSQPLTPIYTGPLDCFRKSLLAEGPLGLYRGISAPLVGAAIETSSLFFSYRIARDFLGFTIWKDVQKGKDGEPQLPLGGLVMAGGLCGAFTSLLLTPIELIKCQMQVRSPVTSTNSVSHHTLRNPLKIISEVFTHHGIFGFWHGQLGTLIRETGGSAAWFGSYEGMSAFFKRLNAKNSTLTNPPPTTDSLDKEKTSPPLPLYQRLLAGATAGISYNLICFPADTVKSRMQTEEVGSPFSQRPATASGTNPPTSNTTNHPAPTSHIPSRQSFYTTLTHLYRTQGFRGLYRGCGITCLRAAPSSAIMFVVYEGLWERDGGRER